MTPKQIDEKLSKMLKEYEDVKSSSESMQSWIIQSIITTDLPRKSEYQILVTSWYKALFWLKPSDIINVIKSQAKPIIVISPDGGYAIVGWNAKVFAQSHNLRGGWSDSLFQGKDEKVLEL